MQILILTNKSKSKNKEDGQIVISKAQQQTGKIDKN